MQVANVTGTPPPAPLLFSRERVPLPAIKPNYLVLLAASNTVLLALATFLMTTSRSLNPTKGQPSFRFCWEQILCIVKKKSNWSNSVPTDQIALEQKVTNQIIVSQFDNIVSFWIIVNKLIWFYHFAWFCCILMIKTRQFASLWCNLIWKSHFASLQ